MDSAVIFDVDGVLLELVAEEENLFFQAFAPWCDPNSLSRDWNSYRIRNDDDIVDEIMMSHNVPLELKPEIIAKYLSDLREHLKAGGKGATTISGAAQLLHELAPHHLLGIATANFCEAAHLRLRHAKLWHHVNEFAEGADGGGHKHEILARLMHRLKPAPGRILFIGDNINDVEAGLRHGVHFIGFSPNPARRASLKSHGATHVSATHAQSLLMIRELLPA